MVKNKDLASVFDEFDVAAAKKHKKKESRAESDDGRATALVSMTKSEKARLTAMAKAHGLSLLAFFRPAADEYIAEHNW